MSKLTTEFSSNYSNQESFYKTLRNGLIVMLLVSVVLVAISYKNYLFFHVLVEFFTVGVAIFMFVIVWHTYDYSKNHFLMLLGVGYFWIGWLDGIHTLLYFGMPTALDQGNYTSQFWIATRSLEAFLLLVAPLFMERAINRQRVLALFGVIAAVTAWMIFMGIFPDTFIDGVGLTPFKVNTEYFIIVVLLAAMLHLRYRHQFIDSRIYQIMLVCICFTIAAELAFTFYISMYDISNLLGHLFKLFSFWLIYVAIIHTSLTEPFRILGHNLRQEVEEHRQAESTHRMAEEEYSLLLNSAAEAIYRIDTKGICTFANLTCIQMLGYEREGQLIGQNMHDLIHHKWLDGSPYPVAECPIYQAFLSDETIHVDTEVLWRADGSSFPAEYWSYPIHRNGEVIGAVVTFLNINQRKQVEEKLLVEKQSSEDYINSLPGLFYIFDNQRFVKWNSEWNKVTGYSDEELSSRYGTDFFEGNDKQLVIERILNVFHDGYATVEAKLITKDGRRIPYYFTGQRKSIDGEEYLIGLGLDISERIKAEEEKEQLLYNLDKRLKELGCLYEITETTQKYVNLDDILYNAISIMPQGWQYPEYAIVRIILDDKEFFKAPFVSTEWKLSSNLIINNRFRGVLEVYYTIALPELDEGPFLNDERKLIDNIAKTLSDAIERKNIEAELKHLATHDALTGLYNRKILEQRINSDILRAARYDRNLSIFMIDIDLFKLVNDTYGHQVGDTVLQSFTGVLKDSVRMTDYAARYGGEEFIVVLTETHLSQATELAERLRIDIAKHTVQLADGKELNITISIGIASYPEHAHSWNDLLKVADSAMYAAKNAGRNCIRVADNTI